LALLDTIKSALGAGDAPRPSLSVVSPEQWIERARRTQPQGYARAVETALAYYRGWSQADALSTLQRLFPLTADKINLVTLDVLRLVVDEQARVFAGEPEFILDGADEETQLRWAAVVEGAETHRKLMEADRLTRACRRYFVRVTADLERERLKLTLFPPSKVFPIFDVDRPGDLDAAEGVLLELAPDFDAKGNPIRRWEFWSAGEAPANFIVDETGAVIHGETEGRNIYVDDAGRSIVPLVSFSDSDEDAGYWMLPSEALVSAQRTVNSQVSNLFHVAQVQGFGQWKLTQNERNAETWKGTPAPGTPRRQTAQTTSGDGAVISTGPETPMVVPFGWQADHVAQNAPLADLFANLVGYLRQVAISERIPPGAIVADGSGTQSGVALAIQRLPLSELRRDRVALFQRPTTDLLNVMRLVWNAHFPAAAFAERAVFAPGEVVLPTDPEQAARLRDFEIRQGLTSAAREIAKREGIALEEAKIRAAEIQAENRAGAARNAADIAASLRGQTTG
jgi:hypothetical protein